VEGPGRAINFDNTVLLVVFTLAGSALIAGFIGALLGAYSGPAVLRNVAVAHALPIVAFGASVIWAVFWIRSCPNCGAGTDDPRSAALWPFFLNAGLWLLDVLVALGAGCFVGWLVRERPHRPDPRRQPTQPS
jgi:hypothetical protein